MEIANNLHAVLPGVAVFLYLGVNYFIGATVFGLFFSSSYWLGLLNTVN